MTKQKIVVRVSMDDQKSRSKALKICVCISGVESAAVKGDQVEVMGEGIDAVQLTRRLRKSMSHAELVSVGEVKNEGATAAAKPPVVAQPQTPVVWMQPYEGYSYPYSSYTYPAPAAAYSHVTEQPGCTIM